ncbi:cytochrome P450 [Hoyosella sp. YIM 151337]|uniref:cytochrome P450 n=1 Tax=Hoyosella sp. YIM 151337 TaxID=2992742 RepID=UPI002235E44E|nr:cytochrome P450 [Hoyosella sp. YIM 151337]MCW4355522.1 cytochrome P450 [Hoyosella sp. YIM 151337]
MAQLGAPSLASGVIARRRLVMSFLEKVQADAPGVEKVRKLRAEHGAEPLEISLLGRNFAIILDHADVGAVLSGAPEPFHPANQEKKAALGVFQPHGSLISEGEEREVRRETNERALGFTDEIHAAAEGIVYRVVQEAQNLCEHARVVGTLDADEFTRAWWRIVRTVVLGPAARDDSELTDMLWHLRATGNWAYFRPGRKRLRDEFTERLHKYVENAPPDSLAGSLPGVGDREEEIGQIPHWLFAFDAAGMASIRALALLATHPEKMAAARGDAEALSGGLPQVLPYLRACVQESVRLWPTTPVIIRDSTEDTHWQHDGGKEVTIPAGTAVLILAAAFHRDAERLTYADRFEPEIWLDGRAQREPALVPFSAGPGECPGQNVVLLVTSTLLAQLILSADFELTSKPVLTPNEDLPETYNNFGIEFAVR